LINKLTKSGDTVHLSIDLELDAKPYQSLMQARSFFNMNKKQIENLINKLAYAKCSFSIKELTPEMKPAIINSLKRLGFI